MAAPQITTYTGDVPVRTQDQTTFSNNTANLLTWWPNSVPETNTAVAFVNDRAIEINSISQSTASLSDTIVTASNFKGDWASLSGALNVPATVYHDGIYWQLLINVSDVTGSEPSLTNTEWALSAQAGNHVIIQSPFSLVLSGNYYIIGSGTITIPNPTALPDGQTFNFRRQPSELPAIVAGTDLVTTRLGLTDGVVMGVSQVEFIVYNGLYEV